MSEPDRARADDGHRAEGDDPDSDPAPAGARGRTAGRRDEATEQGADGGGPVETRDGPEPGDLYVPV
jgi:hypothetical protein